MSTVLPRPRVLIVDDDPAVRMTLAANLELEGFEILEAESGAEALELVKRESFDVLVTDIRMPGMNGIELLRALKTQKADLVAIVMTAFALERLVDEGIAEGAYTILRKPFDVGLLASLVSRAAQRGAVLVVDDQPEVAGALSAALESVGIRAIEASDGAAALARLARANVDACLVDLVMPQMTGAEVCRQIRHHHDHVVVLTMTGEDVPDLIHQASASGSYSCLRKPFGVQALLRTLTGARRVVAEERRRTT